MCPLFSRPELEWIEPNFFSRHREKISNVKKSFFKKIGLRKILIFSFFFTFSMFGWFSSGTLLWVKSGLFIAMCISIIIGILVVYILYLIESLVGTKVQFWENVIVRKTGEGQISSWNFKDINCCKIFKGIYKDKEYIAIEIGGLEKYLGLLFLSEKIPLEKVLNFFDKKGIKYICQF